MSRALVLGGGGPVGIAWEAGLIAGLARAGVKVNQADHIVGTSAGSFVGAMLALEHDPQTLIVPYAKQPAADAQPQMSYATSNDYAFLAQKMSESFGGERPGLEVRLELAEWALRARTISEQAFIDSF